MSTTACVEPSTNTCSSELESALRAFLLDLLSGMRRKHHVPLFEGLDGANIVRSALQKYAPELSACFVLSESTVPILTILLSRIFAISLADDSDRTTGASIDHADLEWQVFFNEVTSRGHVGLRLRLEEWVTALYERLEDVHPKALEISALRVQGYDNRDIARQLDLTHRIVALITSDCLNSLQQLSQLR